MQLVYVCIEASVYFVIRVNSHCTFFLGLHAKTILQFEVCCKVVERFMPNLCFHL